MELLQKPTKMGKDYILQQFVVVSFTNGADRVTALVLVIEGF